MAGGRPPPRGARGSGRPPPPPAPGRRAARCRDCRSPATPRTRHRPRARTRRRARTARPTRRSGPRVARRTPSVARESEGGVVVELAEDLDRPLRHVAQLVARAEHQAEGLAVDAREPFRTQVADVRRIHDREVERVQAPLVLADLPEAATQLPATSPRRGLSSVRISAARSRRAIAAGSRRARLPVDPRSRAGLRPPLRARGALGVPAELAQRAAGLLEVVAWQGRRRPACARSARSLRARARAGRPLRLRDPGVGGVADKAMREPVPILPGGPRRGPDEARAVRATSEEMASHAVVRPRQSTRARRSNRRPITEAHSSSASSRRGSWSSRAAITASIVGGMGSAPGAASAATAASCSRKSGFPSATAMISARARLGAPTPASRASASVSTSGPSSIVSVPGGPGRWSRSSGLPS